MTLSATALTGLSLAGGGATFDRPGLFSLFANIIAIGDGDIVGNGTCCFAFPFFEGDGAGDGVDWNESGGKDGRVVGGIRTDRGGADGVGAETVEVGGIRYGV